jgi:hypothetical protein
MTVDAVQIRGGGEEPIVFMNSLTGMPLSPWDVLEHVLRHQRLFMAARRHGRSRQMAPSASPLVHAPHLVGSPPLDTNAGSLIVFM